MKECIGAIERLIGKEKKRGVNVSNLNTALEYTEQILGTPYGWWSTDEVPSGSPAWAENAPAPYPEEVLASSCFCAGLTNLMLRSVGKDVPHNNSAEYSGGPYDGGCLAYGDYFYNWSEEFSIDKALSGGYPHGTLIGRYFDWDRYYADGDEGHVAVLLNGVWVCQSYPAAGVSWDVHISDSNAGGYYHYAVFPEYWINY